MLKLLIGFYLIADGLFSMVLVWDKRNAWQIARMMRVAMGVLVIVM